MLCPICGSETNPHRVPRYRACPSCSHAFLAESPSADHLAQVYGDDYFTAGGAGYADYLAEGALLRERGRRYGAVLTRELSRTGRVLDVGAAAGFVLAGLTEAGWPGVGIEPNASMARFAGDRLGLDVRCGALETVDLRAQADCIVMIQVVAHLFDLRSAFDAAERATESDGAWLVQTWNGASFTARLFGPNWHEWSPPSVRHVFTPQSLDRLAASYGMSRIASGRPKKTLIAGHAKSLLKEKALTSFPARVLALAAGPIPDDVTLPYPAEDLFWALYRR